MDNQIALLRSASPRCIAKATLVKAQADYDRGLDAREDAAEPSRQEELDQPRKSLLVAEAQVEEDAGGGLPDAGDAGAAAAAGTGNDLTEVPKDLDQTFSIGAAGAGRTVAKRRPRWASIPSSYDLDPKQLIDDSTSAIRAATSIKIYAKLLQEAPASSRPRRN